jgi:hypothetical protein
MDLRRHFKEGANVEAMDTLPPSAGAAWVLTIGQEPTSKSMKKMVLHIGADNPLKRGRGVGGDVDRAAQKRMVIEQRPDTEENARKTRRVLAANPDFAVVARDSHI